MKKVWLKSNCNSNFLWWKNSEMKKNDIWKELVIKKNLFIKKNYEKNCDEKIK